MGTGSLLGFSLARLIFVKTTNSIRTREIRIHILGEWRVLYVAKFANIVFVLHVFQKKTQKTRSEDVELAQRRYRQIEEK